MKPLNEALRVILSILGGIIITVIIMAVVIAAAALSVSLGFFLLPIGLVALAACAIYFETQKPDS